MLEYVSEAIVLHKEPNADLDSRISLFTKQFGKLTAKVKSIRKITSKLAGHLEPGSVVDVRLVEKNGLTVADALKISQLRIPLQDLDFLHRLLAEGEPDMRLWEILRRSQLRWPDVLKILGWDPESAVCEKCGQASPKFFQLKTQEFFCDRCASPQSPDEVLCIG